MQEAAPLRGSMRIPRGRSIPLGPPHKSTGRTAKRRSRFSGATIFGLKTEGSTPTIFRARDQEAPERPATRNHKSR